jgi:hypothetical protein
MFAGLMLLASVAFAQNPTPATPTASEKGAIMVYADGGWSFGLPAVRAVSGSIISPERKTLAAPSFGIGVTAWKFVVPFFDATIYDTGKATATSGVGTSQAQADTATFIGGVRLVAGKSRVRGYGEFGGGVLYQNLKSTFLISGQTLNQTASASVGSFMYGAGLQVFAGRRWGSDIGFDGFHVTQPLTGGSQNFSRIRIGVFFQTKSAIP